MSETIVAKYWFNFILTWAIFPIVIIIINYYMYWYYVLKFTCWNKYIAHVFCRMHMGFYFNLEIHAISSLSMQKPCHHPPPPQKNRKTWMWFLYYCSFTKVESQLLILCGDGPGWKGMFVLPTQLRVHSDENISIKKHYSLCTI